MGDVGLRRFAAVLALGCLVPAAAAAPRKAKEAAKVAQVAEVAEPMDADPFAAANAELDALNLPAARLAVADLTKTFGKRYPNGRAYLARLAACEKGLPGIRKALAAREPAALRELEQIAALRDEALLANPLLGFGKLLLIKRKPVGDPRRPKGTGRGLGEFIGLPRQSSWQHDRIANVHHWDNEIALLSPVGPDGRLTTVYRPPDMRLVCDVELHFDSRRMLFSMPDDQRKWQVFEVPLARSGRSVRAGEPRQVTPAGMGDVHNYDGCYLPDERIAFISTAPLQGVPCNASVNVGMLYVTDADGRNTRQLAFDQDHNYCPTVTGDGQILYLRWEYTDIPHVWGRYLFAMNPDGTNQREFYGSGEYWPNGVFYARPIPGQPTRVAGIVTGHHVGRVGELVVFDSGRGLNAHRGVVRRIPSRGQPVEPLIQDKLTEHSWPKFLHPMPLADPTDNAAAGKYFLVSAKPTPGDLWGIYLVDVFDNITRVRESEGYTLQEPIPLAARVRPPVIADRVDMKRKDGLFYIEDIHAGPGLKEVPRGAVRKLRLFSYHFVYQKMAGINHRVGTDGPWEPKRVLGTVPVEADGSAFFRVPANTPISIQPLDEDGGALQLMRSWTVAMPGEIVSCVGCHEQRTDLPSVRRRLAVRKAACEIRPWHGPVRGFSFSRDVQLVLDRHCVACHDGKQRHGRALPDLRAEQGRVFALRNGDPQLRELRGVKAAQAVTKYGGVFPPSYVELRRYIRIGGFESDIRLLPPGEFHADTSELVQMLLKGHHGVKLDAAAWDRLLTWIDLNGPCHGTWREVAGLRKTKTLHGRRRRLRQLYAGLEDDPEAYPEAPRRRVDPITPKRPAPIVNPKLQVPGWPFDAAEARRRQGRPARRTIDLGEGVKLALVRIPAGQFVMGDAGGERDEQPVCRVSVPKPLWIGQCEVTNEQYRRFEATHDSRFEHKGSWVFSEKHLGWRLNHPAQPVVRVSQAEATAFCRWLSAKAKLTAALPTEAQWEYACRAGTAGALWYGEASANFSAFANLADATIRELAYDTDGRHTADVTPRVDGVDDGQLVTADVGGYKPNAWGLYDMHGNAWEWTRSAYRPYPYKAQDGRETPGEADRIVVRGGSWRDRPKRCRSAFRLSYPSWRKVFNVGFRVVVEE